MNTFSCLFLQNWLFVGQQIIMTLLKVIQQLYSLLQTQCLNQPQSAFKDSLDKLLLLHPAYRLSLCVVQELQVEHI